MMITASINPVPAEFFKVNSIEAMQTKRISVSVYT